MTRRLPVVVALSLLAGCFDSLVTTPCAADHELFNGLCMPLTAPDAGARGDDGMEIDGGVVADAAPVSPPDALACVASESTCAGRCVDLSSDSQNCGACGRECASGSCDSGSCTGELSGHVVFIGHDYRTHNGAMRRVLANSAGLGAPIDVGIARWRGTSSVASTDGTTAALTQGMFAIARPWHAVVLPAAPSPAALADVDVLLIEAQTGDGDAAFAAAEPWASAIDAFLEAQGVVVVLEGSGGVSHRFAAGAGLFTVAAPTEISGMAATVITPGDAVAQHVVSPYLAQTTSVVIPGATGVIATSQGAVVTHETR